MWGEGGCLNFLCVLNINVNILVTEGGMQSFGTLGQLFKLSTTQYSTVWEGNGGSQIIIINFSLTKGNMSVKIKIVSQIDKMQTYET